MDFGRLFINDPPLIGGSAILGNCRLSQELQSQVDFPIKTSIKRGDFRFPWQGMGRFPGQPNNWMVNTVNRC